MLNHVEPVHKNVKYFEQKFVFDQKSSAKVNRFPDI